MAPTDPATAPTSDSAADPPTYAAVLLAAGTSSRLGRPKQLVAWRGRSLVRRAAETLARSRARPLVAVVGPRRREIEAELAGLGFEIAVNRRYADGQATSVAAGLRALAASAEPCRGALFAPCDQPLLTAATIDRLLAVADGRPGAIVRPVYGGRPGAPVLFPRELFPRLLALRGDEGGRQLMRAEPARVVAVEFGDALEGFDIDTDDDLERLESAPR